MALSWRTRQKNQNWIIAGYKNWRLSQKALNLRKSVIWNAYFSHSVPLRLKNFKKNHWIKSLNQKVQYNVSFSSFRYILFGEKWFRGILGFFTDFRILRLHCLRNKSQERDLFYFIHFASSFDCSANPPHFKNGFFLT